MFALGQLETLILSRTMSAMAFWRPKLVPIRLVTEWRIASQSMSAASLLEIKASHSA